MLNGNGVAGSAANGAYLLRPARLRDGAAAGERVAERADAGLLPHDDLLRQAPDGLPGGRERALQGDRALDGRRRSPRIRSCVRSTPGRCSPWSSARRSTTSSSAPTPTPSAPKHEAPNVRYDASMGLDLAEAATGPACRSRSRCRRCSSARRIRTTSTATSPLASTGSTSGTIRRRSGSSSGRAPASTGGSRRRTCRTRRSWPTGASSGRSRAATFTLYYTGSNLHMVVLRVHDKSYWVVNTLLDSLSNETMLAIATGLKPLRQAK